MTGASTGCADCLRRAWLIARLSGHIERAWAARRPLPAVLSLADDELIAALAGEQRRRIAREYDRFDAALARERCVDCGLTAICRCAPHYPQRLRDLPDAPAVLHLLGRADRFEQLIEADGVAIVGARRATPYGIEQARGIARGLAAAGITVVSGMALGIDAAAHTGALEASGSTLAVLAGGAERAYPASKRRLHERIAASGVVVSEMPPGTPIRRWAFPARNRTIAALARLTVVVEAGERSGSLITATLALDLGRDVAAVPGLVTAPLAAGTNGLIAEGARLIRGPQDVLELLFGADAPRVPGNAVASGLPADLRALLERVGSGQDTVAALTADGLPVDAALAGLAQLELRGKVRRTTGGRYACLS
ncbi:DNA-processing protein DprA [Conexibacter woesei]|uniref:DNA protecting protein DprA n=1 Tax=Conexibacter woesei (strain DSM 14684 / CCUG 47730 / CIP 108061 / JCM 11494 / NBRC 100937 / ID131577) TaxID=469383 RepID=D3F1C7_CONWI|nr:DNA-processing protein DprA [Conexibacter woesei]ADB52090.1 DNA protecting protein DprA [Conexibacter woesei DSM 14684]